jgi:membrane-associated protein
MDLASPESVGTFSNLAAQAVKVVGENAAATALGSAMAESLVGVGALFPGGTVVILSGFAARAGGGAEFAQVAAAAWLGMTLGTVADFWLGRLAGRRLVPRRAPWRLACRWRHTLRSAHAFMTRWGWWAILVANLAGPGRSAVAVAAGASGWSFWRFFVGQALASIFWALLYTGLGYFAGGEATSAKELAGGLGIGAAVLLVVALILPSLIGAAARVAARFAAPQPS